MILDMTESHAEGQVMAVRFLRSNPDIWHAWLPADAAARADTALNLTKPAAARPDLFPDWSAAEFVNQRLVRSDERRVGNAFVSKCRSRWSPDHYNKIIT